MSARRALRGLGRALPLALALLGAGAGVRAFGGDAAAPSGDEALRQLYFRPQAVPFPADNPYNSEKAALGRALFFDTRLSGAGGFSCATCHMPERGFEDGQERGVGEAGERLARHTPTLWNLAWGELFFWDGRADSLEAQAASPIESHVEMNRQLEALAPLLAGDPELAARFARAFPENPRVSEDNILKALATFERTLVSPLTRFDVWVAGDGNVLDAAERRGFALFNGKAGCASCHEGWAFTDHAFHDVGLPGEDRGRGAVLGESALDRAFKTPTLRDLSRRAPYMHDGRFATLGAVLDHYEEGIVERPTLSPDLKRIELDERERADLLAFLRTLDGPEGDSLASLPPIASVAPAARDELAATPPTSAPVTVSQRDKAFRPGRVAVAAGTEVRIVNDDVRTHNVRIHHPAKRFDAGLQAPGETVSLTFETPGAYHAICAIHPKMRLKIEVSPASP